MLVISACEDQNSKRILYINSYHKGYPSSDDIQLGILDGLKDQHINLEIFYMDTKRNSEPKDMDQKVLEVLEIYDRFAPHLIIASDDNAAGKVVAPHLQNKGIPVVFCGVNWSAERYRLGSNVTGMLEVMPLQELILTIKGVNPDIRRIAILSENSVSEQNNSELLDTLYRNLGFLPEYFLVNDFMQWKEAFLEASYTSDLIYMPTNGAIRNWDREEAIRFVKANLNVPSITCDDFMMDYCVFGLTKVAREQGEWAAQTALQILNGKSPAEIPYTKNQRFHTYLNSGLAEHMGFHLLEEPEGDFTIIP